MDEESDLEELRERISRVTLEILHLCGKRFLLVRKVGEIKLRRNMPIENREVEEMLKRKVLEKCCTYGVDAQFGLQLLKLLIDESKRIQKSLITQKKSGSEHQN